MRFHEGVTSTIRAREEPDVQQCAALLAAVHTVHRYPIHWPDDAPAWLTPGDLAAAWVAVREREIVGHVCLTHRGGPAQGLALERLFVSPTAAGQGIGRALVTKASDWAADNGDRLTLEVVDNCVDAISLYRRLGWHLSARTQIDWGDGSGRHLLHFEAP